MWQHRAILSLLVVLALVPHEVRAQMRGSHSTRPLRLVVSGGMSMPTGTFKDFHDTGFHADASLLLNIPGFPIRLRPELSLTRFNLKDALPQGVPSGTDGYSQLLGGFGNIELPLGGGPIQIYVLAGLGALDLTTDTGVSGSTTEGSVKFAVNGGAGLRFRLGSIDGFLEGRVNSVYTDKGALNFKDVKTIPVTFGLVF